MEGFAGSGFMGADAMMKKRRSATRRPRQNAWMAFDARNISAPSLSNSRKLSPDDNRGSETIFRRKEFHLNNPPPRNLVPSKKVAKDDKAFRELDGYSGGGTSRSGHLSDLKHCGEGILTPAKWKSTSKVYEGFEMQSGSPEGKSGEGHGMNHQEEAPYVTSESKLRKVKLKVGGITRTIHAKSDLHSSSSRSSSAKPPRSLDASSLKLNSQDFFDGRSPIEKGNNLQGDPWKDSCILNFPHGTKEDFNNKAVQASLSGKQAEPSSEPTRKSKRVPKRRVFDDVEGDDEIHYAEKHKTPKIVADHGAELEDNGENCFKKPNITKLSRSRNAVYEVDEEYILSRSSKENRKKSRQGRESDDTDYVEEEEPGSDVGPDSKRKKHKATVESPADARIEPLTTRQRALQSGKAGNGESLIEFPNGLPPAPSRKQKEKLSEVEKQAKKAEAAQRRKIQVEKQARESEAEAIRKILGRDSDKKKEEKKQKELEEKAKAAKSQTLQPSTIRWVMGPTSTVVTFADDVGLPSIFSSKPSSYPPPREKCAGPSCTNAYKYRDSKTKLPLCSLQCYRAIQGSA